MAITPNPLLQGTASQRRYAPPLAAYMPICQEYTLCFSSIADIRHVPAGLYAHRTGLSPRLAQRLAAIQGRRYVVTVEENENA